MPHDSGRIREKNIPIAPPIDPPQTIAGANTPPEPPEPTVKEVATAFAKNMANLFHACICTKMMEQKMNINISLLAAKFITI